MDGKLLGGNIRDEGVGILAKQTSRIRAKVEQCRDEHRSSKERAWLRKEFRGT